MDSEKMEKNINIGGRDFEIKANFRKSCRLSSYRNKMKYGNIVVTEENKEYLLEIEQLREKTEEGKMPDITKLSTPALKILQQMSDKNSDVFNENELLEIGQILLDIEDVKEVEDLYNEEFSRNGYDELVSKILYGLALVFMNAKDGSTTREIQKKTTRAKRTIEVAKQ